MASYITFEKLPRLPQRRTDTWECHAEGESLGVVKRHSAWRRFCFFPKESTLVDAECLSEIAAFMGQRMKERA